jgi:molecular chaperone GrpE
MEVKSMPDTNKNDSATDSVAEMENKQPVPEEAVPTESLTEESLPGEGGDTTTENTDTGTQDGAEAVPSSAEAQLDEIAQLRQELAAAQAKADEHLDKLQRMAADFQNSRRRQEKQLAEDIEHANAELIRRLLPVLDDLDLAFKHIPAGGEEGEGEGGNEAWIEGFRQIRKKLLDILGDQGVTRVATEGPFDPARHEAVTSEPSEAVESGHIIETLRAGYEYKGRMLRPSLVRVAV